MSTSGRDAETMMAHCNACLGERRQTVLSKTDWENGHQIGRGFDEQFQWGATFYVLQCRGCDHVNYIEHKWNSEDLNDDNELIIEETYFPNKIVITIPRRLDLKLWRVDDTMYRYLNETINAFHSQLYTLTGMGIRTILDHLMKEILGEDATFTRKISMMKERHYISQRQADTLTKFSEIGHGAVHRGYQPEEQDIAILLDYTFYLLSNHYELESEIEKIYAKVPQNPNKVRPATRPIPDKKSD